LPYRALGTGVQRALKECPELRFTQDPEAETFTVTIPLPVSKRTETGTVGLENEPVEQESEPAGLKNEPVETKNGTVEEELSPLQVQILNLIRSNSKITYDEMAEGAGKGRSIIRRHVKTLREKKVIRRVGSDRHGHWEFFSEPPEVK
jgi:predicted HTH transcriptional regulator